MALNCEACSDLREYAPDFVLNGVTDDICLSLENDTGLNPTLDPVHTDCDDLHDINDCLVGNMEAEVDAYEVCDWKTYIKKIIPNIHQTFKSIICSICGIWKNIHRILCIIDFMLKDIHITVGESVTGDAYCVAGKGVSFLIPHTGQPHTADITMSSFGLILRLSGSYRFFTENFTDEGSVGNFDNDDTYRVSQSRKGNSRWAEEDAYWNGGELICELRIKKTAYPTIRSLSSGFGQDGSGGLYHTLTYVFTESNYAYGQHGTCNKDTGVKDDPSYDNGHLVPTGWVYIQLRCKGTFSGTQMGTSDGLQRSPLSILFMRTNEQEIHCD